MKQQMNTSQAAGIQGSVGRWQAPRSVGLAALVTAVLAHSLCAQAQGVPAGRGSVDYEYSADGELTKITDGIGRMTEHEYDSLGRRRLTTLPKPSDSKPRGTIRYDYSPSGLVSKTTDPRRLSTTSPSNGLGEINPLQSPDTGKTRFTYYPDGKVWTSIDARDQTTTYFYDGARRLTKLKFASGKASEFEYDGGANPPTPNPAIGKLSKMTDESGQTTFDYDGFGRSKAKKQVVSITDQAPLTFSVSYQRGEDADCPAEISSMRLPSGVKVSYKHNLCTTNIVTINPLLPDGSGPDLGEDRVIINAMLLLPRSADSADPSTYYVASWYWGPDWPSDNDDMSKRLVGSFATSVDMGPSKWMGRGYSFFRRNIFYDDAGQPTAYEYWTSNTKKSANDESFAFDGEGRLTQHLLPSTAYGYDYDANGNRTLKTIGADAYPNVVSSASNRLDSSSDVDGGTKSYQYELSGQTKKEGTTTFTYSARGRLSSMTVAQGAVNFLYNGLDQRVAKFGPAVDGGARYYVYDDRGQLLGEYDASGKAVYEVVWINDMPMAVITFSGTNPIKTTVSVIFTDELKTPRVIMGVFAINGINEYKTRWRWNHGDAFGNLLPQDDPDGMGKFEFNLRFPGQVYDKETELFYNGHRDYSAKLGRYVQSDPIGVRGGINTYAYVGGNPLSRIDPQGLLDLPTFDPDGQDFKDTSPPPDYPVVPRRPYVPPPPPPKGPEPGDGEPWPGPDDQKGQCIRLSVLCRQNRWTGDCNACELKCIVQGEWPFQGRGGCRPRKQACSANY